MVFVCLDRIPVYSGFGLVRSLKSLVSHWRSHSRESTLTINVINGISSKPIDVINLWSRQAVVFHVLLNFRYVMRVV
jgi:hypothetical protein